MAPITIQSVEEEYKKNYPDLNREDVQHIMDWIQKQPHLPNISELQTIIFLHSCLYKIEYTKSVIDLNYTMRTHVENIFKSRDVLDKKVQHQLDTCLFATLPKLTPEGNKVIYCRLLNYEPKNFVLPMAVKAWKLIFDLLQWEEGTWNGFILIIDLDKVVLSHLARLDILTIRQVLMYLQDAMPTRLYGFHFMNTPYFMDRIMAMLNPFIRKEMLQLLHLHPKPAETMFKFVPKELFPKEIGGDFFSFEKIKENTKAKLLENRHILIAEEKLRVNESLRPGKPKNMDSVFGLEGSFKKLDID